MKKKLILLTALLGFSVGRAQATTWKGVLASTTGAAQAGMAGYAMNLGTGTVSILNSTAATVSGTLTMPAGSTFTFSGAGTVSSMTAINLNVSGSGAVNMGAVRVQNISTATAQGDAVRFNQLKVIQVKWFNVAVASTSTKSAIIATNQTVSITPTSASNSIAIIASGTLRTNNSNLTAGHATLLRNTTNLGGGSDVGFCKVLATASATNYDMPCTMTYVDAPNTTSATSYTVAIFNDDNSTTVAWNNANGGSILVAEIAP